jgi:hypothetical protein
MILNTNLRGKCLSLWLATAATFPITNSVPILTVDTTVGTVQGLINGSHPDVAQFLIIPYAESPVGNRRWAAPVAKSPLGKIDAARFSPSYPQYDTSIPSMYEIDVREFLISGLTSEDCLTLSCHSLQNIRVTTRTRNCQWLYSSTVAANLLVVLKFNIESRLRGFREVRLVL